VFTGVIREIGTVEEVERTADGARLRVSAGVASGLGAGDSVSVDGVCLTVTSPGGDAFEADVMNQTLSVTTLGTLDAGGRVNLEPALRAGEPLGGHLVQGHVDSTGEVTSATEDGFARRLRVAVPEGLRRYVAEHGSVAIDGVSLTVAALEGPEIRIALIPHTLAATTLGAAAVGDPVNIEVDMIGRYVAHLMERSGR